MFEGIFYGGWGFSIVIHFITTKYKKSKLKKRIINELENLGYDINKNLMNEIFNLMDEEFPIYSIEQSTSSLLSFVPLVDLIVLYNDITYLLGNHINEPYWDQFSVLSDAKIEYLLNEDVISENKEKMQFIEDKNNALKELENKYEDIELHKHKSTIMISENDSEKELYEKLEQLQEIILRKQNNSSDDIKLEYKINEK